MNLSKVIRFSLDEIARRKKQFFFSMLLLISAIVLMAIAIYLYSATDYNAIVCDDALAYGNAGTYYLYEASNLESDGADESFISDMRSVEGLCNFGEFYVGSGASSGDFKEMANLQKGSPYIDEEDLGTFFIDMNADAFGLFSIKLKDDVKVEIPPKDTKYLYLGEELSSIPIGSVLKFEESSRFKYIVKGYIESGQVVPNHQINLVDLELDTFYYNLDKLAIAVSEDGICENSVYYFNIEEGADKSQVINEVNKVLEEHEMNYYIGTLEYSFENRARNDKNTADILLQLAVIIIISVIFIQICMQSSDIISNSRKYGIMYANGFTKADIRKILCVQNIIKLILAFILAVLLLYVMVVYFYGYKPDITIYNMIFVFRRYVLIKLVLISMAVMAIGSIVPLLVLENMSPAKLMKANK